MCTHYVASVRTLVPLSLLQAIDLQKVQKAKADALVLFELFLDEVSGRPYNVRRLRIRCTVGRARETRSTLKLASEHERSQLSFFAYALIVPCHSGYAFSSMLASRRIESAKVSAVAEFQHLAQVGETVV